MAKQNVWVLGNHAINAVMDISPERALALWVAINSNNSTQKALLDKVERLGIPIHPVDKKQLEKQCDSKQTQGVALQARPKVDGSEKELEHFINHLLADAQKPPLLLILDQVQDPHNFGACLRTADAAGADLVVVAKDNASPMTPVVQKVASGAAEAMPVYRVTNLARTMDTLKQQGIWMMGTSDKATHSLYQESLTGPLGLVMGAEGKGMRQLTEQKCDTLVSLPMAEMTVNLIDCHCLSRQNSLLNCV